MKKKLTFLSLMLGVVVSVQAQNATTITAPLFLPFTYYENVAHEALSLDEKTSDVNATLLNFYLKRPDLVATSESQLREQYDTPEITEPEQVVVTTPTPEITAPEEPEAPQVDVEVKKPNFWTYKGDGFLQFLQNYVSGNWYKGGESNYSMLSALTLEANYDNKSKWKWDNKLELKLGFQTSPSDTVNKFKTNEDLIRLTSKVGLQASKRWYYTLQFIGYTQFTRGLKANDRRTYSDFMSPFDLNLGVGMEYKLKALNGKLTGSLNFSPLSFNFRYVARNTLLDRYKLGGHHTKEDFGSQFTGDVKWTITDQVTWKSRLYYYTSYHRGLMEWENQFRFQVSKYISANLFLYPRFDDSGKRDDKLGYFQFQEYCSLGLNYSF